MNKSINELTEIRFGFQGQPQIGGNVAFLQLKQFNEEGNLINFSDEYLKLDNKSEPHLLKDGDVLFAGKGSRLFAWCYYNNDIPTIASSSFFVLRPNSNLINSEYFAAIMNAPQIKAALLQLGGGTNIFSIRKSELGAFQIPLLPMGKQKSIAAISSLHSQETMLASQIMTQKQNLYSAIISKFIK